MLNRLTARIARKGFVGPRYRGLAGKVRFALEAAFGHEELLLVNTPESFCPVEVPWDCDLTLHSIRKFEDLAPFAAELDAAYYPGYVEAWRKQFSWGERGVIATVDGHVAGFDWLQYGTATGFPTYWGPVFEGECRFLRAGVLPGCRGHGVNRAMKCLLLQRVFEEEGINRVYAEVHTNNIPSLKTLLGVGFRTAGLMTILEVPPLRKFIRWSAADDVTEMLRAYGVELEVPSVAVPGTLAGIA